MTDMTVSRAATAARIVRSASVEVTTPGAARVLAERLGPDLEAVILFAAPACDLDALFRGAEAHMGGARLIGCSTAGEIDETGYAEGRILAIGLPRSHFRTRAVPLASPAELPPEQLMRDMLETRNALAREAPDWRHEFAFLLIDGLSQQEDRMAAAVAATLGSVPLFGGSAGDMERFGSTRVFAGGAASPGGAALLLVRSACPVRVFKSDHFQPTERRMVITGTDPERRRVTSINGAPAAEELARIIGIAPAALDRRFLAAHPLVVRIAGEHHVRSISHVGAAGELHFFSAIGTGLVLSLAASTDMAGHLRSVLDGLAEPRAPDFILGCDCLLRRLEAREKQQSATLSALMRSHRLQGFSTYGEQLGAMHVNQTLTGVAIYPPADPAGEAP
ncbi:FIST C-terminal domain-containing protein [Pseudooceanicola sp. CBS1P-1]|uniref:GfdT protein n=1 Tax=Pseudooceanicola albus TaxID=2692189 RepID=A0A6L7G851_9RHOB|nr:MULTISPECIES: FIST N-terminal domain-containing protein [Pseudooceanicola]MBT9386438.1 FIST C-terminal domain-containing protein [Pseudooceanicola endophyticus]MXN20404.1 GfdT protein [Pseudooceanicola albus]